MDSLGNIVIALIVVVALWLILTAFVPVPEKAQRIAGILFVAVLAILAVKFLLGFAFA